MISQLNNSLTAFIEGLGHNAHHIGQWNIKTYPCVIVGDNIYNQLRNKQKPQIEATCRLHIFSKGYADGDAVISDIVENHKDITIDGYDVNSTMITNNLVFQDGQITHNVLSLNIKFE